MIKIPFFLFQGNTLMDYFCYRKIHIMCRGKLGENNRFKNTPNVEIFLRETKQYNTSLTIPYYIVPSHYSRILKIYNTISRVHGRDNLVSSYSMILQHKPNEVHKRRRARVLAESMSNHCCIINHGQVSCNVVLLLNRRLLYPFHYTR